MAGARGESRRGGPGDETMKHYGDLQTQIYQDGLRGVLPDYDVPTRQR